VPAQTAIPATGAAPDAAPPAAVERSHTLTPPVPLSLPPPQHPLAWRVVVEAPGLVAEARPEAAAARVRLRFLVHADGTVGAVEVVASSGRADLDAAAVAAARGWRFAPARRDGVPVVSRVLIWVAFILGP
jgi:protein TonB